MRVIITGSRTIDSLDEVLKAISKARYQIDEVMSGCAKGPDYWGEIWAKCYGIRIKRFPADWEKHGKAAGILRNLEMARYADALIAVWDGQSKGTKHMIDAAKTHCLSVTVHEV